MLNNVKKKQNKRKQPAEKQEAKSELIPVNNHSNVNKFSCDDQNNRCRICLNVGLIPIYNANLTFDVPDAIQTISGVEIDENDEYPKHLCGDCHSLLRGAVLFRKSARESDEILRQTSTYSDTHAMSEDDIGNELEAPKELNVINEHQCKTCQVKFKTLEAYTRHKNTKKHKNVRIQCRICMKLLTKQLYEKHLARHQSATHLVCDICGKLYRKDNLLRHLQLHSNELPFQCQVCPYRGRFMESLKIHTRTHSGDKPFSCDKCELRFITRSNLNRHLLTHEKEKPFKCLECSRGFYTQRDLDVHLRADHAGIKEFSCRVCGNKYGTKKALMRHELRVHKRIKMAKGRMPLYLQASFQNSNELTPVD